MNDADWKNEIIERAKFAAEHMGVCIGGTPHKVEGKEAPIWSLKIELLDASVSVFWLPYYGNLRIRASLHAFGHWGSVSVLDMHEKKDPPVTTWHGPSLSVQMDKKPKLHHYTKLRIDIRDRLRQMMVLDDLARVPRSE